MRIKVKFTLAFLILSVTLTHAAWKKVSIPQIHEMITCVEFANPNLGYATVFERYDHNFLYYRSGYWTLGRLPGMFLGIPSDISLLPSGYGWAIGVNGGIHQALYTGRTWGTARQWEYVSKPVRDRPLHPP